MTLTPEQLDEADLIQAREWAAGEYTRRGASFLAKLATAGKADDAVSVLGFLAGLKAGRAEREASFQSRVEPWMMECFGPTISSNKVERGDRLLEEVFELLQSGGYDPARVLALRDYVWNRPVGDPPQEVGGVMVTLAAYCLAFALDMHEAGETELARIWTKVEAIRAKQAAKPTGSALPVVEREG